MATFENTRAGVDVEILVDGEFANTPELVQTALAAVFSPEDNEQIRVEAASPGDLAECGVWVVDLPPWAEEALMSGELDYLSGGSLPGETYSSLSLVE